jgi:cytochrome P450
VRQRSKLGFVCNSVNNFECQCSKRFAFHPRPEFTMALFTSTTIYGLLVAFFLYTTVSLIRNYVFLSAYPGPLLAKFSRFYMFTLTMRTKSADTQFENLHKYGSPVRMGPNLLITDDADVVRHMAAPRSGWTRSKWYNGVRFDPRKDTVFSTRDEKLHTELKAKMTGAYNGKEIDNLESDIDDRILDLMTLIRETYVGKVLDISKVASYFTIDVLSTIAFGFPIGNLKANKDIYEYHNSTSQSLIPFELMLNHPFFSWLLSRPFVRWLAAPKNTDELGFGQILGVARKSVAERFEGTGDAKDKRDMLGIFKSKGLDQLQCEVEAALQILAGNDSTSTIIRCTLFQLAGNQLAYGKLKKEIDEAGEQGRLSSPVASFAEAQKLEYLQDCIWEGIRLWPPLFGTKAKLAPKGGDTIKGMYFPEGTEVGLCDAAMCRNKKVFGEDAEIYRPDRWAEACPETRHRYQYVVESIFGAGKWTCLGKHIAMMELHKVFVEVSALAVRRRWD